MIIKSLLEDITKVERNKKSLTYREIAFALSCVALRMLGVAIAKYIGEEL